MFDFLYSEVWWMETIIAAGISAVAALLCSYFMYSSKTDKIMEKQESHSEQLAKLLEMSPGKEPKSNPICVSLREDHQKLGNDHTKIMFLGKEINKTAGDTNRIVHTIKDEQLRRQKDYELLSKEHQNMSDVLKDAGIVAGGLQRELLEMQGKLTQLQGETEHLRQENQKLAAQIRSIAEEKEALKKENGQLLSQIHALEEEIEDLEEQKDQKFRPTNQFGRDNDGWEP